jgi:hypothetical protein
MDEFMGYFDITDSKFNRAIFGIVGCDGRENITFIEFVVAMWNFLTIPPESISSFAFMLLATTSTTLVPQQIISLFEMIYTKESLKSPNMKRIVDDLKQMTCETRFNVVQFAEYIL